MNWWMVSAGVLILWLLVGGISGILTKEVWMVLLVPLAFLLLVILMAIPALLIVCGLGGCI